MNPEQLKSLSKLIVSLKSKVICPICLDHIENTVELECSHRFCNKCLSEVRSQTSLCPLCKAQICKRAPTYKDLFADELSKFTNRTCQLIKEKYAHEVDELCSKNINLEEIIKTSPREAAIFTRNSRISKDNGNKKIDDAFNKLMTNPRRSYGTKPKVLNFDSSDTRSKIINWLNDNQEKLDILTQSPKFLSDDDEDFQMPSISQVPMRNTRPNGRIRSQSLNINDNLPETLVKRYKSLTEGLPDLDDDYNIEEVHSETLVKQVERKVLQDMLEDECLATLEHVAQLGREKPIPSKRRSDKTTNIPHSGSSSGWDRIKNVKKTLKKALKEPKQLNINLQDTNHNVKKTPKHNVKKSPKVIAKKSPVEKHANGSKRKSSPRTSKFAGNKENKVAEPRKSKEGATTKEDSNIEAHQTFNLSAVENYFEKHMGMDNNQVPLDKNTSSDIDIISVVTKSTPVAKNNQKETVSNHDNSCDDDIFFLPTQVTPQSNHQQNAICQISPAPTEINDINTIAIRLTDNLKSCILSAANLNNTVPSELFQCFTNLLTYADKIIQLGSEKVSTEMQTSQPANFSRKTAGTQTTYRNITNATTQTVVSTDNVKSDLTAQAANLSRKTAGTQTTYRNITNATTQTVVSRDNVKSDKYVQYSQQFSDNVGVQTDALVCFEQGIQTTDRVPSRITEERSAEEKQSISYNIYSLDEFVETSNSLTKLTRKSKSKTSPQSISSKVSDDQKKNMSFKSSEKTKSKNQLHISVDNSNETKSNKSNIVSQESVLVCTLDPSNTSEKKINRKLTFVESQNRKFKRIRKPASDSDSDGGENPSKRKFIRDDLTVEFIDTEKQTCNINSEQKVNSTPDSEKMDYDKYLLEVMNKYDPSPPKKKKIVEGNRIDNLNRSNTYNNNAAESSIDKKSQKLQITSHISKSPEKSLKDTFSGDHIFTANIEFQENLDKFDKEIMDFERTTKVYNTEFDLVENTPLVSSKAKITRNKKKDSMLQPLQIISKGSASSSAHSHKPDNLTAEDHLIGNLVDKEPSTLNQNIDNLPSQTEKCTDEVAGLLEDLQNNDEFFKNNDEDEMYTDIPRRESKDPVNDITMIDMSKNDKLKQVEKMNVSQEYNDVVLENLNEFDDNDDDDIEEELRKISFTAAQREVNQCNTINILQNVKLRSPCNTNQGNDAKDIIDSSDTSDEEIVETTPQKRNSVNERSLLEQLEKLQNSFSGDPLDDFCLPPPPGFGDDGDTSPQPENLRESPENLVGILSPPGNISSLTPDRLSDFIVTPDERPHDNKTEESQRSLSFKPSFITPTRPVRGKLNSSRISQIVVDDSEGVFSPIAKNSIKLTQAKYNPLISTPRLAAKKSNLMTSTPNQKSILNYVVPSQDSTALSQKSRPCIMWSRIMNKDLNIFTQLECKKLLTTSKVFNHQVTHLVVLVDEKGQIVSHTAKILQAIAAGIWVVRYEWAQDCLKMNRIVAEEPYEAIDTTGIPGPQIARLSRGTKPLFQGFKFYCAPPLKTVPKVDLESILQLSAGEIARDLGAMLENDGKVHIILTESSATEETDQFETWLEIYKAVTVDVEWLTSCIGQYKLVSFRPFLISGDESAICDLGYPPTLVESVPFTLTEAM